jgi:predicted transcriptional regulator
LKHGRIPVTIQIDSADHAALSEIARDQARSFDEVAAEALRARIDNERDFDAAVRAGLADIEAGRIVSQEDYLAGAAERRRRWLATRSA